MLKTLNARMIEFVQFHEPYHYEPLYYSIHQYVIKEVALKELSQLIGPQSSNAVNHGLYWTGYFVF